MDSRSTLPSQALRIRQSSSRNHPKKQNQYCFQSSPLASAQPARQCCLQRALPFRTKAARLVSKEDLDGSRHLERLELGLGFHERDVVLTMSDFKQRAPEQLCCAKTSRTLLAVLLLALTRSVILSLGAPSSTTRRAVAAMARTSTVNAYASCSRSREFKASAIRTASIAASTHFDAAV